MLRRESPSKVQHRFGGGAEYRLSISIVTPHPLRSARHLLPPGEGVAPALLYFLQTLKAQTDDYHGDHAERSSFKPGYSFSTPAGEMISTAVGRAVHWPAMPRQTARCGALKCAPSASRDVHVSTKTKRLESVTLWCRS